MMRVGLALVALFAAVLPPVGARAAEGDQALIEAQPGLVASTVAAMQAQRPGVADVFFVGFAGYGGQRVFHREATFARDVFAQRYGAQRRSLLLVNDESDRDTLPLASRTNLRHALRLIGARMDPEEDVLVLLLTSHGTEDELEVRNGDLPLAMLQPGDVRAALDAAGIRWRVVIASACFAGIFIRPLRDASTLVVAAADARHSSFGCDDERELTWFGEAFLRDALPRAGSLEEAFAMARGIIMKRERVERFVHSRPQIHVGSAIRAKLAQLEASRTGSQLAPAAQVN